MDTDVTILGGGLAGLTLALQLKQSQPNITIRVLELRKSSAPTSAHKVGESTVELGTHYLREVLGLGSYLDQKHLPKQGLRFFFSPEAKEKIEERVELGARSELPIPSHQIDRGVFENDLAQKLRDIGVQLEFGSVVRTVDFSEEGHRVGYYQKGTAYELITRWLVDTSGRASFLKRKLGFEKKLEHHVNAVWFRVEGEIDVDDWSDVHAWKTQFSPGFRRLGTLHFMGKGYWVWFIPLSTGNTSIGIVADPRFHDFSSLNSFEKAMQWLALHEPLCAQKIQPYTTNVLDFRKLKQLAHHSGRFYSNDRWGVVGESAAFLDPFYSPGTDFIALGNTWLSDLILRDFKGEDIAARTIIYERVHAAFFQSWVPIYQNQYALFDNTQVMVVKILWDWAVYWAIPTLLFTNAGFTNIEVLRALFTARNSVGIRLAKLNSKMQQLFQDWSKKDNQQYHYRFIDFFDVPFIKKLHMDMNVRHTEQTLIDTCTSNLGVLEDMAAAVFQKISTDLNNTPEDIKCNPYTMNLNDSYDQIMLQSNDKNALSRRISLINDMELMWLENKMAV